MSDLPFLISILSEAFPEFYFSQQEHYFRVYRMATDSTGRSLSLWFSTEDYPLIRISGPGGGCIVFNPAEPGFLEDVKSIIEIGTADDARWHDLWHMIESRQDFSNSYKFMSNQLRLAALSNPH